MEKRRQYFQTRIGRQMLTIILAIVVPLLAVNLVIVTWGSANIRQAVEQNYSNALNMAADQIRGQLVNLQQYAIALTVDDDINKMSIAENDRTVLFDYSQLRLRLNAYTTQQKEPQCNILAYFPKQGWIVANSEIIPRKSKEDAERLLELASSGMQWDIRPGILDPEQNCLSLAVGYVHMNQSNPVFFIELREEAVLSMLRTLGISQGILGAYLMSESGEIFLEGDFRSDQNILLKETGDRLDLINAEGIVQFEYRGGREKREVIVKRMDSSQCVIGIVLDERTAFRSQDVVGLWSILAVIAFLAVVFAYMFLSFRQIIRPITQLQTAMKKVGSGDFSGAEEVLSRNEIGDIAVSLNRMTQELKKTIDEKYISEMQLAQTQMKFLRAQINPHFLYNSLFSLYTLIKNEALDEAADLTIYLGQYYQLNTRSSAKDTSLYQELEYIRLLVRIQNLRSANHLDYWENIDDTLKMLTIPRLTLLTVAENFLTHGFKNLKDEASLGITAAREDGRTVLTVSDTGVGMTEEQLDHIRKMLDEVHPEMENLHGLQNVLLRFRAMYGQSVTMCVAANAPHGLNVKIMIPQETEVE